MTEADYALAERIAILIVDAGLAPSEAERRARAWVEAQSAPGLFDDR